MSTAANYWRHHAQTTDPDTCTWYIWTTTADSAVDHAVTDDAMAAGMVAERGRYRAVCGALFAPAPLISPPAPACPQCLAALPAPTPSTANHAAIAHRNNRRTVGYCAR